MKSLLAFILMVCLVLTPSCKDDDYVYPSVVTDFVGAQTDENGYLTYLITDQGKTYRVLDREGLGGLRPDTLYRSVSIYQPFAGEQGETPTAQLYSCQVVLSLHPIPAASFNGPIKTDPVDIQSIWLSGGYINLILRVQVKDQTHTYHFVDEGIVDGANGIRTLNLRLYHDRNNDYEAFTHRAYLSVPLTNYKDKLHPGDKVRFYLNTYEEGETFREFDY